MVVHVVDMGEQSPAEKEDFSMSRSSARKVTVASFEEVRLNRDALPDFSKSVESNSDWVFASGWVQL